MEKKTICAHPPDSTRDIFASHSSLTAVHHPDVKCFDIEADMAEAVIPRDPNARPKHFTSPFEECVFVFTVMMSAASTTFLQGVTVINTATIGRDLNMTAAEVTWISAALGLSSGSFVLFFGKTADLFGRKVQLLAGLAFLSLSAIMTSFAPNGIALNILLGLLGLGTAAIAPPSIGILFTAYPPGRRRNMVTGALGCGNPLGFVIGSISSGVATKYFSWRASFIVVAIFFFAMTVMAFLTVPSIPRAGSVRRMVRQFDYLGTVLTIIGMATLSAALTEGPEAGWKSPKVIVMLVLGFIFLVLFAVWENIYTHPLLDPSIWKNQNFTLCILCVLFGYMSFITNQFWISLYMQKVQLMSPLHIAARLLPQTVTGIIWSYMGQLLVSRVKGTAIMGIGALAYIAGATFLIFIRQNTSYWALLFPSLCITVMGADFQFIVANLYINTQMPDQSSLGAGVLQTAMRLSISLGLAITSAVYGTTSHSPRGTNDIDFPYERAYLCTILFAVAGFLFVPFMRIGKQDGKTEPEKNDFVIEERPRTGGVYSDMSSGAYDEGHHHSQGSSTLTANTMATAGSQVSFFTRWSWEDRDQWKDKRYRESNIVYEVCIKCLEERRIVVRDGEDDMCGQKLPVEMHSREPEELERGWTQLQGERRKSTHEMEEVEQGWTRLSDERNQPRHEHREVERGWTQPLVERKQSRHELEEVERGWTRLPDEGIQPRPQVERAWQRFPAKLSTTDFERGDVSKGGDGWL